MAGIVCAIRGGPASQPTIRRAIELAREHGKQIHFLYVVNLNFLERTATSRVHTISKELRQMGDFILLKAQVEANGEGVEADASIREGNVGEEIIALCKEMTADFVVLGLPSGESEHDAFTRERMRQFAARIEEASGAKPVLAEGKSA